MTLKLPKSLEEKIKEHGEKTYPFECCGIIGGTKEGHNNIAKYIYEVNNSREDEAKHNRYIMTPKDVLAAEKMFAKNDIEIIGFYHSHPDHPAKPSQFDLDHASWPIYSYVIVAVEKAKAKELTSWTLRNDRSAFDQEEIIK